MATISITDIVTDDLEGAGSFDKLMAAVELRLESQYAKGRIQGADYANVYLGAMQSVLQQSIAFTLGVQQADKQADLIASQITLSDTQVTKTAAEELLLDQKLLTEEAQILDTVNGNTVLGIVGTQKTLHSDQSSKVLAEKALLDQKLLTETAQILDTVDGNSVLGIVGTQKTLHADQSSKILSEKALLDQKKFTEEAQILDTVDGNSVLGIVGKQKTLYTNQSDGFTREAEIKAAKVFTDLWTIAKSTSPDDLELALPLNVDQHTMDVVLAKVAENGLGLTTGQLGTQSAEFSTHLISAAVDPGAAEVIITTSTSHGMTTGTAISIASVGGMTELNGNNYIITATGATTFTLDGTDGVAFTTYTSGGVVTEL